MAKTANVKIYTKSACQWCVKAKVFLKAYNIKFEEINIATDEKAREEMFKKSGQYGVPVIDVDGAIIIGYDKEALKKALGL